MGLITLTLAATVGSAPCLPTALSDRPPIPPAAQRVEGRASAPYGDPLGDVWEMEEVACWRGIWIRRANNRFWDGYWVHHSGERVRATLELWRDGRSVTMVRRHDHGQYCRYDGTISADWWTVAGRYTCTWERTPMPWRAYIVRTEYSHPQVLRAPGERNPRQ